MPSSKTNYIHYGLWMFIIIALGWFTTQRPQLDGEKSLQRIEDSRAVWDKLQADKEERKYQECVMQHGRDYCSFYEAAGSINRK